MNITIGKNCIKPSAFVTIQLWTIKWKLVCYASYQLLTWERGDKKKTKWWGGDYSREAINRGRAIIRGNMVIWRSGVFTSISIKLLEGKLPLLEDNVTSKCSNQTSSEVRVYENYVQWHSLYNKQQIPSSSNIYIIHMLVLVSDSNATYF